MGTKGMIMTAVLLTSIGLVVNVIATAGIGNTFSLMIAEWAGGNLLIAIVMVAIASLVLGMCLPVTAAYIVLATLSAPALAGIVWPGWRSLRQWGVLDSAQPAHPADKPEDRHRFLGHAAFLLPIISGIGVAFVSPRLLPIEGTCQ